MLRWHLRCSLTRDQARSLRSSTPPRLRLAGAPALLIPAQAGACFVGTCGARSRATKRARSAPQHRLAFASPERLRERYLLRRRCCSRHATLTTPHLSTFGANTTHAVRAVLLPSRQWNSECPMPMIGFILSSEGALIRRLSMITKFEKGQGLAEYALILALIAILAIVALMFLSGSINTILSTIGNKL